MRWVNGMLWIYAILLIAGGFYGYFSPTVTHPSVISLIAGSITGLLVIGSLAWYKSNPRAGRITAAVVCLLVMGQMVPDSFKTGKWDIILLAVASLIVLLALVGAHFFAMSRRKNEAEPAS